MSPKSGVGWTFAYNEKPFDRIIRLSNPVDLRQGLMDGWSDAKVAGIAVDEGKGLRIGFTDPVIGEIVSLGKAKFQAASPGRGDKKEALVDFHFSIGGTLLN